MDVLKVKVDGNWVGIPAIKGDPADAPVQDVQINGTSIVSEGVANVPVATSSTIGAIKSGAGTSVVNDALTVNMATSAQIKVGTAESFLRASKQHEATFYGLAKASGDTTQAASENVVGTYTADAKAAILNMIGAVGKTDIAGSNGEHKGIAYFNGNYGVAVNSETGGVYLSKSDNSTIKAGTNDYKPIVPSNQNASVFYGLAAASGDTTQSSSNNTVGTYTPEAKAKIWEMLGLDGSAFVKSDWELIREDTVTNATEANVDITVDGNGDAFELTDVFLYILLPNQTTDVSIGAYGRVNFYYGSAGNDTDSIYNGATTTASGEQSKVAYTMITQSDGLIFKRYTRYVQTGNHPQWCSYAQAFESTNAPVVPIILSPSIRTYKNVSILSVTGKVHYKLYGKRKRNGLDSPVINVSGTMPSINALPGHRYICGEVTTISITPPQAGTIDVVFESGSTPAVLTVPSTVKFPAWFDSENLEANKTYEINILDGVYGVVTSWA